MNKKQTLERQERNGLLSQLDHLTEYLADCERLHYRLKNGEWNADMSTEEREGIEAEIKRLRKVLGYV